MLIISKAIFQREILNLVVKKEFANFLHQHTYIYIFLYQTLMVNGNLVPTLFLHRPQWYKISFEVASWF